jgi:hypothetical protein
MLLGLGAVQWVCPGHGTSFGSGAEILSKVVAFACWRKESCQFVLSQYLVGMMLEALLEKVR